MIGVESNAALRGFWETTTTAAIGFESRRGHQFGSHAPLLPKNSISRKTENGVSDFSKIDRGDFIRECSEPKLNLSPGLTLLVDLNNCLEIIHEIADTFARTRAAKECRTPGSITELRFGSLIDAMKYDWTESIFGLVKGVCEQTATRCRRKQFTLLHSLTTTE